MKNSDLLRFDKLRIGIAVMAVLGLTFSLGCDASPSVKTSSNHQDTRDQQVGQRELTDAGQLADHIANEKNATQDPEQSDLRDSSAANPDEAPEPEIQTIEIPSTWKRLSKNDEIWIDTNAKEVIIAGRVCLNQGALEMFICPAHTKEHESVISANATALQVHLALTALGADPGKATSWEPEYRAAYGPTIKVTLKWQDDETKKTKTALANQWIRDLRTKKAMEHLWVFGGSQFWEDPDSHERVYYGDAGELICLSNFSTATIDLNVQSSQSDGGLLFEAFTENIPPIGTKVYAIIKPGKRIEPVKKPTKKPAPQIADDEQTDQDPSSVVDASADDN